MTTLDQTPSDPSSLPEVTVAQATEVLRKGLVLLRNWTERGWNFDEPHRQRVHQLIDDLHNHPAFIEGDCPESVIRAGNAQALATIQMVNADPKIRFPTNSAGANDPSPVTNH